jgi:hypothetical protein
MFKKKAAAVPTVEPPKQNNVIKAPTQQISNKQDDKSNIIPIVAPAAIYKPAPVTQPPSDTTDANLPKTVYETSPAIAQAPDSSESTESKRFVTLAKEPLKDKAKGTTKKPEAEAKKVEEKTKKADDKTKKPDDKAKNPDAKAKFDTKVDKNDFKKVYDVISTSPAASMPKKLTSKDNLKDAVSPSKSRSASATPYPVTKKKSEADVTKAQSSSVKPLITPNKTAITEKPKLPEPKKVQSTTQPKPKLASEKQVNTNTNSLLKDNSPKVTTKDASDKGGSYAKSLKESDVSSSKKTQNTGTAANFKAKKLSLAPSFEKKTVKSTNSVSDGRAKKSTVTRGKQPNKLLQMAGDEKLKTGLASKETQSKVVLAESSKSRAVSEKPKIVHPKPASSRKRTESVSVSSDKVLRAAPANDETVSLSRKEEPVSHHIDEEQKPSTSKVDEIKQDEPPTSSQVAHVQLPKISHIPVIKKQPKQSNQTLKEISQSMHQLKVLHALSRRNTVAVKTPGPELRRQSRPVKLPSIASIDRLNISDMAAEYEIERAERKKLEYTNADLHLQIANLQKRLLKEQDEKKKIHTSSKTVPTSLEVFIDLFRPIST